MMMRRRVLKILLLAVCALPATSLAMHRDELPAVMSLAHELEERAGHVLQAAEQQSHHFDWRERQLLRSLQHFAGAARGFHGAVESYFVSPVRTEELLEHLNSDADRVESTIYRAHALRHVVHDWDRCALILRQLNHYVREESAHFEHGDAFDDR